MKYKYFISYHYKKGNENYFASCTIEMSEPLDTAEMTNFVRENIMKENNHDNAIILFWKELK